jgi:hypothetical protein
MPIRERSWHGDEIKARADRAVGRAIVGMGESVSAEMKGVSHVVTGNLKRSIHAARPDTMGEVPASTATVTIRPNNFQLEVGSWLPYACVENNRGGDHRFADLGWQLAEPGFDGKLIRAWREEDL